MHEVRGLNCTHAVSSCARHWFTVGSPWEAVYRYGWKALPILLEQLETDGDRQRRASLLAILANITGLNGCSGGRRVVGPYRVLSGPVATGGSARTLRTTGRCTDRGPTTAGQAPLIESWKGFRHMIKIVEQDG